MKIFLVTLVALFLLSVLSIESFLYLRRRLRNSSPTKVRKRLKGVTDLKMGKPSPEILRQRNLSSIPVLNNILYHTPGVRRLDRLAQQANAPYAIGVYILLSIVLGLIVYFISTQMTMNLGIAVLAGIAASAAPYIYLIITKKNRMEKFLRQLPEALDMIARGLRAGHAFATGMKLAIDNFEDPLGTEFSETLDEINFGVSVPEALKHLAYRIDCPDLRFFVISVILQRETGGNLAEIIEGISHIIRERFRFHDKVRVLSAEVKLSAKVLVALPFVILLALYLMNPGYVNIMFEEELGRMMLWGAGFLMLLGIIVIMKMIKIRV